MRVRTVSSLSDHDGQSTTLLAPGTNVDLIRLIREEELYSTRIRDALVSNESKIVREPVMLASVVQQERDRRRVLYTKPTSIAEREEQQQVLDQEVSSSACRRRGRADTAIVTKEAYYSTDDSSEFINPSIDKRRTVADNDALYSSQSQSRIDFTYADLVAAQEGRKQIRSRALRPLANLWDINTKLVKEEMLAELISEYARRFEDEVAAYEAAQRSGTPVSSGGGNHGKNSGARIRRRGRKRR